MDNDKVRAGSTPRWFKLNVLIATFYTSVLVSVAAMFAAVLNAPAAAKIAMYTSTVLFAACTVYLFAAAHTARR